MLEVKFEKKNKARKLNYFPPPHTSPFQPSSPFSEKETDRYFLYLEKVVKNLMWPMGVMDCYWKLC